MKYKNQKGQSLVEFVLVLPLLLIMLFGIIEFSLIMYNKAVITNASREGARAGTVFRPTPATTTDIETVVNTYISTRLISFDPSTPQVTVSPSSTPPAFGDTLTVTVDYNYGFLVLPNFISLGNQLTLSAQTIMNYE